jgi:multiple sugar transport system substrate-binding protein
VGQHGRPDRQQEGGRERRVQERDAYNAVFAQTVPHLKDFYNNPEYSELLNVTQKELSEAISGGKKPKEALDAIAAAHDQTLQSMASSGS